MDREDSIDVEFISEPDANQAELLDTLVGKKIWNIEFLESDSQSMIKIIFSDKEDHFLVIHCDGADLYLVEPKPDKVH